MAAIKIIKLHLQFGIPGLDDVRSLVIKDNKLALIAIPTEAHPLKYSLKGWATTAEGEVITSPIIQPVPSDLYAIWDKDLTNIVTYDMELSPEITFPISGKGSFTLPATVDGKNQFQGWARSPGGAIIEGPEYTPAGDETLYAVWTDGTVSHPAIISFNANGGSGFMPAFACDRNFTFPDCGFTPPALSTFDHWEIEGLEGEAFAPGESIVLSEDVDQYVLIAHWKGPESFKVTYWKNETTSDSTNLVYYYPKGKTFVAVQLFFIEGKTFKGWSVDRAETVGALDGYFDLTGNIDLYAIWE